MLTAMEHNTHRPSAIAPMSPIKQFIRRVSTEMRQTKGILKSSLKGSGGKAPKPSPRIVMTTRGARVQRLRKKLVFAKLNVRHLLSGLKSAMPHRDSLTVTSSFTRTSSGQSLAKHTSLRSFGNFDARGDANAASVFFNIPRAFSVTEPGAPAASGGNTDGPQPATPNLPPPPVKDKRRHLRHKKRDASTTSSSANLSSTSGATRGNDTRLLATAPFQPTVGPTRRKSSSSSKSSASNKSRSNPELVDEYWKVPVPIPTNTGTEVGMVVLTSSSEEEQIKLLDDDVFRVNNWRKKQRFWQAAQWSTSSSNSSAEGGTKSRRSASSIKSSNRALPRAPPDPRKLRLETVNDVLTRFSIDDLLANAGSIMAFNADNSDGSAVTFVSLDETSGSDHRPPLVQSSTPCRL
jgi:hypothetical protein